MYYNLFMIEFRMKTAKDGNTAYFTLIHIRHSCELTFGNTLFHTLEDDLLLCRENIFYHTDTEDSLSVYEYSRTILDGLFEAQTADCRIIYDFMHMPSGKGEYLYFTKLPKEVISYLSLLRKEAEHNDLYHEKIIRLLTVGLVSELDRCRPECLMVSRSTMLKDHVFGKILNYISDHISDVTLEKTARQFGYNPDYFSSWFHKVTGETFSHKLLSMRMEEAMHLLITTEYTIAKTAALVGYQDRSHFSRNFREYTGLSPKEYRRVHAAN